MKNLKLSVGFFLILFSFLSSILFLKDYNQNKLIYLFFSIVVNFFFIKHFFTKFLITEFLFSFYLWFGFWFSVTLRNILIWNGFLSYENEKKDVIFSRSEGIVDYKDFQNILDDSLLLIIFIFVCVIFSFYFINLFYRKLFQFQNFNYKFFFEFYSRYKNSILILLLIFTSFVAINNFIFSIYQKGITSNSNLLIVTIFFKWAYLIGFPFLFSVILFLEIRSKNSRIYLTITLIIILSSFLYISNLSRAMIFEILSILIGIILLYANKNQSIRVIIFTALFGFTISVLSIFVSEDLRNKIYFETNLKTKIIKENLLKDNFSEYSDQLVLIKNNSSQINKNSENNFKNRNNPNLESRLSQFLYVILNRWVGLEAVVLMKKKEHLLNFELFKEAFNEKKSNNFSFYEQTFIKETSERNLSKSTFGLILPGIIAFLYYPGSHIFLFFSIFLLVFFLVSIEKIVQKISSNNYVLVSVVSNIVVYRLIHFGYAPKDSYLLFGSLFLTLFIYYLIINYFRKN